MAGRPKKDDSREKQYRVRLNDEEDKMLDYARQVQLRQIAEEAEPDESWEDDRISLQRVVECPYCHAKNRIDLEDEGTETTGERQMGCEVIYEFEDVEFLCHNCGRSFAVSGYISEYPIGAFNFEDLKISQIEEDEDVE